MTDRKSALGDIIGSTKERLEETSPMEDKLRSLVASTSIAAEADPKSDPSERKPVHHLPNYFPQVEAKEKASAKRRPDKGPPRSEHISMRLTPDERIRLNYWCDARNLSIPDGVMALLSIAERLEGE